MLRRLLRLAAYGLASLCLLTVLLLLFAWWFFPAERVRQYIADNLSAQLHRPVHLGELQLHMWGATVHDIQVPDSEGGHEALIQIDRLQIQISLRHLLAKRLIVNQLIISHPRLRFIQRHGEWNFQSLLSALKKSTGSGLTPQAGIAGLPLALGLELDEVRLTEVELNARFVTGQHLRLTGLNAKVVGEISTRSNNLSAQVTADPNTSNLRFEMSSPKPFKVKGGLQAELQLTQNDFRTLQLSGSVRVQPLKPDTGSTYLPFDLRAEIDLGADLQSQELLIKHVNLQYGEDNVVQLSGRLTQLNVQPKIHLELSDGAIGLTQLAPIVGAFKPVHHLNLRGRLLIPHLVLHGPDQEKRFYANGNMELKEIGLDDKLHNVSIANLQAHLPQVHATLQAFTVMDFKSAMTVDYDRVGVAGLHLIQGHHKLELTLAGKNLGMGALSMTFLNQKLNVEHASLGLFNMPWQGRLSVEGDLFQGDLTAINLDADWGEGVSTQLSGSIEKYGKKKLALKHLITAPLNRVVNLLPQHLSPFAGTVAMAGIVRLHNQIEGALPSSSEGRISLHSQLAFENARWHHPDFGKLDAVQGLINLQTLIAYPGQLQKLHIDAKVHVQQAQILDRIQLTGNQLDVAFNLAGQTAAGDIALYPKTLIQFTSETVRVEEPEIEFETVDMSLDLLMPMKTKRVSIALLTQLPQLIQQPKLLGSIKWKTSSYKRFRAQSAQLSFTATADSAQLEHTWTEAELLLTAPQFGTAEQPSEPGAISLQWQSQQEAGRGMINLDTMRLHVPGLFELHASGEIANWGGPFTVNVEIPTFDLARMYQHILKPYLPFVPIQLSSGKAQVDFNARGKLPTLSSLESMQLPEFSARIDLSNLAIVTKPKAFRFEAAAGSLRVSGKGNSISIVSDGTLQRLKFPGFQNTLHSDVGVRLDYRLYNGRRIEIKQHELRLPSLGMKFTMRGEMTSFPDVLARDDTLSLADFLYNLDADFTMAQRVDALAGKRQLLPVTYNGSIHNELHIVIRKGKGLEFDGRIRFDDFSATIPSVVNIEHIQGGITFKKRLQFQTTSATAGQTPPHSRERFDVLPPSLYRQLRTVLPKRNNLIIDHFKIGSLSFSDLALDIDFNQQQLAVHRFETTFLDGAIAGSLYLGHVGADVRAPGVHLSSEFAQLNMAALLPDARGEIPPHAGEINGNLDVQLLFPPENGGAVGINALSVAVHITQIGKQALDRLLLFLDPDQDDPAITNQRRLLTLATPRLVTIRLKNGVLNASTELDTPLGRKHQPISPIPLAALESKGFPQFQSLLEVLQQLQIALRPIVTQHLDLYPAQ